MNDLVAMRGAAVRDAVARAVVGKDEALELVLLGILADGHVLIEDVPGVAKTLMARSFAAATGMAFARVQFTPDLLPGDVTGSSVLDPRTGDLELRPGPVFTNLLLGDEINRAPPKTQAALLEAMEERQVTIDGTTHVLDRPFVVIATQNPIEFEGTYPLPEAQLDRFLLRVAVGYPSADDEWRLLANRLDRKADAFTIEPVLDPAGVVELQRAIEDVHVSEAIGRYVVALVGATRSHRHVLVGASPRGSLAVVKLARARAALHGRDFVTPDDVKMVAPSALGHRLVLKAELWVRQVRGDDVVRTVLDEVPTPSADELLPRVVTRRAGVKMAAYAIGAAVGLVGSLVTGRPELAAIATPMVVVLVVGLTMQRETALTVAVVPDRTRLIEGDMVELALTVTADRPVGRVTVGLLVPPHLEPDGPVRFALRLAAGEPRSLTIRARCARWGSHPIGQVAVRVSGALGLVDREAVLGTPDTLKVFPAPARLRQVPAPRDTQARSGSRVSRARGDGMELADLRPFRPGDPARAMNWRATARRGTPFITERHPEREGEVVILLDAFADVGGDVTTLDLAVRAADALVRSYVGHHDRVGLVTFGGYLRWMVPGAGERHGYAIAEALLETSIVESYTWKSVDVIPVRTLPPKSLVVALTPLLDERLVAALIDLRRRGHDVAVVEIDAGSLVETADSPAAALAERLWRLERRAVRARLERLGVGVASWDGNSSLSLVAEEVNAWRRRLPVGHS